MLLCTCVSLSLLFSMVNKLEYLVEVSALSMPIFIRCNPLDMLSCLHSSSFLFWILEHFLALVVVLVCL